MGSCLPRLPTGRRASCPRPPAIRTIDHAGAAMRPLDGSDNRYYSLDIWRGVACLMVVGFHSSYYLLTDPAIRSASVTVRRLVLVLSDLWLGVPIFFVISGYCIA